MSCMNTCCENWLANLSTLRKLLIVASVEVRALFVMIIWSVLDSGFTWVVAYT